MHVSRGVVVRVEMVVGGGVLRVVDGVRVVEVDVRNDGVGGVPGVVVIVGGFLGVVVIVGGFLGVVSGGK